MHLVHIVIGPGDRRALDTAKQHGSEHRVTVLLIQDAVLEPPGVVGTDVVAGERDLAARGLSGRHPSLSDEEIVDLLYDADRVISW